MQNTIKLLGREAVADLLAHLGTRAVRRERGGSCMTMEKER